MAPCRIIDVIERARQFHRQLGDFYTRLSGESEIAEVKQLLDYMARHETYLDCCLHEYEKGTAKAILDTWFKPGPDFASCLCVEKAQVRLDMTVDEVIGMSLEFDECLIKLYEYLAERATCPKCADMFRELVEMEKSEETKVLRAALMG